MKTDGNSRVRDGAPEPSPEGPGAGPGLARGRPNLHAGGRAVERLAELDRLARSQLAIVSGQQGERTAGETYPAGLYSWQCHTDVYGPGPFDESVGECGATGVIDFEPDEPGDVPGALCTRCGAELSAAFSSFEPIPPPGPGLYAWECYWRDDDGAPCGAINLVQFAGGDPWVEAEPCDFCGAGGGGMALVASLDRLTREERAEVKRERRARRRGPTAAATRSAAPEGVGDRAAWERRVRPPERAGPEPEPHRSAGASRALARAEAQARAMAAMAAALAVDPADPAQKTRQGRPSGSGR